MQLEISTSFVIDIRLNIIVPYLNPGHLWDVKKDQYFQLYISRGPQVHWHLPVDDNSCMLLFTLGTCHLGK